MEMEKICPSEEELTKIETSLCCSEPECNSIFKSKSNLNFHLAKHHKKASFQHLLKRKSTEYQYYCPIEKCAYNAIKSFKNMKYLKQHYMKVHLTKTHLCSKCNMTFAQINLKNVHEEYCGISFTCPGCTATYNCYETLLTHARRKGHKIFPKLKYKALYHGDTTACSKILCVLDAAPNYNNFNQRLLLPKNILDSGSNKVLVHNNNEEQVTNNNIKELDILSTDNTKTTQSLSKRKRKNKTSETQTQKLKAVKSTACTQTEHDSVHWEAPISTSTDLSCKKSIKTQTAAVTLSSRACNTSFDINLVTDGLFDVEKTSLGTQTLSPNILETPGYMSSESDGIIKNTISTQSIDNNSEDILEYMNESSFCNSNMETQTDWLEDFGLLANDVYSNNYTQTCNELLPLDLQFNNTHTQTILNDILRSVGSQTNMRSNGSVFMSNIETQTDLIFKELLQEINS